MSFILKYPGIQEKLLKYPNLDDYNVEFPTNATTYRSDFYFDLNGTFLFSNNEKSMGRVLIYDYQDFEFESIDLFKQKIQSKSTVLNINLTEFINLTSTVYGESSFFRKDIKLEDLENEMMAITYVHRYKNKKAFGKNSEAAIQFRKSLINQNDFTINNKFNKLKFMQLAVKSLIEVLKTKVDKSYGAKNWDGIEQAYYDISVDDAIRDCYELHMNTMGWRISDEHYEKWKMNVGSKFKAPQEKYSPDNFKGKTCKGIKFEYKNKGKIRFQSTAVYGGTIFWKEVNINKP